MLMRDKNIYFAPLTTESVSGQESHTDRPERVD